ncbi:MAG TPA: acetate--CoA ligase family protein [Solirubrobacteraceae bacterium]|nr:acetate--CoA ligase family protein [Solirubrobacteraceae bacterium]
MAPRSVAVVGASERPDTYACEALTNLNRIGFDGQVWGVNPRRTDVFGLPCVPSVSELPEPVDAVIVAIPADGVAAAIEQAGVRGCGGAVVFSAGFGEVRSGDGLQAAVVESAYRHRLPVCGPNCNGIVSPGRRVALWGDTLEPADAGAVALISQSGNVAVNALATRRGLRFHTVIASGNQAVLDAADYLGYLAAAGGVGAVALYLEDDGGPRLCDGLAACVDASLPVVVLKVGSTPTGAASANAHSGALAGDQRVFRSLVEEAGAVWAADVHELLELSKTLAVARPGARTAAHDGARAPAPGRARPAAPARGRGLAIMTCSGGDSAQGADEAQLLGLSLPAPAPATLERLRELLPTAATAANPLDYTSIIWGEVETLAELVRALGTDPTIDLVLVFYDQPHGLVGAAAESWVAVREGVMLGASRSPVPTVVSSTLPELLDDGAAWDMVRAGVPAVAGLRTGLRCAAAVLGLDRAVGGARPGGDGARLREIAATARRGGGGATETGPWLAEHEAKALLREAGIAVPDGIVVDDADAAVAARAALGPEIVLKLSAPSVQHKSDLGGVALGLDDDEQVRFAYRPLAELAATHGGVVLAERMAASAGVELIVAAHRDGVVPALVIGLGGVWTELLSDVCVVPLPAQPSRIRAALRGLRGASLLFGGRGQQAVDVDALCSLATSIGGLLVDRSLQLVECNPVLVGAVGALALDASVQLGAVGDGSLAGAVAR